MTVARPGAVPPGVVRRFTRSREQPRGVVWFGAGSFWGHLRHLVASAIATESVDSRDWMEVDEPQALIQRIVEVLGGDAHAGSLVQALGRDLYIDFVADTGDDVAVSRAVARLVFASYEVPDPDHPDAFLVVPRGDVLLFGGDTAYPVATAKEITNRLIVPWNKILQALPDDGRARVLLGLPGNHDWYDGLDGFGRMFRRRQAQDHGRPEVVPLSQPMLEHHAEWAREFLVGGTVDKPSALVLTGYVPVQGASYFALTLAPHLEWLAVDRQLTTVDSRQSRFLVDRYQAHPDSATFVVLPDPVYHFGVASRTGTQMVKKLQLDLASRETFILSGDIHHYERLERDRVLHVIAGGGGAFLHPARIASGGLRPTTVWPGVAQSRHLLGKVPWKLACGRSGFLPHFGLVALFAMALVLSRQLHAHTGLAISASIVSALLLVAIYALIGGVTRRLAVLPVAAAAALITALIPIGGAVVVKAAFEQLGLSASGIVAGISTLAIAVFAGSFVFGAYLALLTLLGYENMQALAVLDHPGFKHFLRLRVRADGRGIDGWCVGLVDPLGPEPPVLFDHFTWRPFDGKQPT
jgi:hypothetical protein